VLRAFLLPRVFEAARVVTKNLDVDTLRLDGLQTAASFALRARAINSSCHACYRLTDRLQRIGPVIAEARCAALWAHAAGPPDLSQSGADVCRIASRAPLLFFSYLTCTDVRRHERHGVPS